MNDAVQRFLEASGFMPHGMCFLWRPGLLALHAGSDLLIALAYFAIPAFLWALARSRDDLLPLWSLQLFGAFILLCGLTHLLGAVVLWNPFYYTQGLFKLATAGVSVATALMVWRAYGRILELPNRNSLDEQVRERTAELEAANADLDAFAYLVSHDLQAPVRHLNGFLTLLERSAGGKLDDGERGHLAQLRTASDRMGRQIDAMLQMSRSARQKLDRRALDLSAMAREAAGELPESIRASTEVDVEPGLRTFGDPTLVRVVLQNLIGNAAKYAAGEPAPRIRVRAAPEAGPGTFEIADNGIGFAMEHATTIFQPFQRLHGNSTYEGSGIGLSTVAKIVARHGGRVWAHAEAGQGASIYFQLPEPRGQHGPELVPDPA